MNTSDFVERARLQEALREEAQVVAEGPEVTQGEGFAPKILVFSTNNISDPGIDLAGSSHLHYSPNVMVISLPCTSGDQTRVDTSRHRRGFDGVFIASDGEECAYLPDCAERSAKIMARRSRVATGTGMSPGG